ncbi:S-methyl thiohydantoin desulfurase domain-containing protein [Kibdelosporangium aridum]|uniref:S-methyl thiohydantoin desulfurase domain-containing protein n=1 Tax=Kibdelosporangium aridum TaxID=2030 RepID=UPI0035E585C9
MSWFKLTRGDWLERLARSAVTAFGDTGVSSEYVMTVEQARTSVVTGSISRALKIGQVLANCAGMPVVTAVRRLAAEFGGICLMEGKVSMVSAVQTSASSTFAASLRSTALLDGINGDDGRCLRVEVGHEYLAILEDGEVRATTPDIITLFDVYSGDVVATDSLRYGQRVVVLALPCPDLWLQPAGLELVGPRAFGLDLDYHPLVVR